MYVSGKNGNLSCMGFVVKLKSKEKCSFSYFLEKQNFAVNCMKENLQPTACNKLVIWNKIFSGSVNSYHGYN